MTTRLPTQEDFPPALTVVVNPPSGPGSLTSVLILLHGFGGSEPSFASFARQLALPETASISIRAIHPLPLGLDGFHWADDISFDGGGDAIDVESPVQNAVRVLLETVIDGVMLAKCGFRTRDIHLFGFGQGGTVALEAAIHMWRQTERSSISKELGGVVSVGGPLSSKSPPMLAPRCPTPVLICKGSQSSAISMAAVGRLVACFEPAEVTTWSRKGDGMPRNRDEILPLMRFWGRRLRSRRGVPPGSVEIVT